MYVAWETVGKRGCVGSLFSVSLQWGTIKIIKQELVSQNREFSLLLQHWHSI